VGNIANSISPMIAFSRCVSIRLVSMHIGLACNLAHVARWQYVCTGSSHNRVLARSCVSEKTPGSASSQACRASR
jgi:hypothetical protein